MLKKAILIFLTAILMYSVCSCSKSNSLTTQETEYLKKNDTIKVALFPYYPPYQFKNDQGDMDGVFIDFLALIEKKINHKFKKVYYTDWAKLIEDAKNNKIDIILEVQNTKDKNEYLSFFPPLFESEYVVVQRKNESKTRDNDFKNQTFILPYEFSIVEIIKKKYPNSKIIYAQEELDCLKLLSKGEGDAYVGPQAVVNYIIKSKSFSNLEITTSINTSYKPGLAVVKKNKVLNTIITKTLYSFSDKEKKAIVSNWLYDIVTPFYEKTSFWIYLTAVILCLCGSIVFFNQFLKYKIKQKTAELRISKEKAEESDRLKTSFIQNISHEIRTPMNGIIGFSELLMNTDLAIEEQKEYAKIIAKNSQELIVSIDNILEIAKLQTEKIVIRPQKIELEELFEQVYNKYKPLANNKNIEFTVTNNFKSNPTAIIIDKAKLIKILVCLIDNALKFTEKGAITIQYGPHNQDIKIAISDTGIGIKAKDKEAIFQNFSQSESEISKNHGGLGLGLSIATKNAQLIGGKITVTSQEGQGSTFLLTIPFIPAKTKEPVAFQVKSKQESKPEKHVILIAEDGEVNFLFLKTVLTKMTEYNFVIHRAENGKKAVEICQANQKIDLVLMDIKMPIMDGYEATQKIKRIRPRLPVVAQTAYSTDEDIQKALEAGCDAFISKPVDRFLLRDIVARYFRNS